MVSKSLRKSSRSPKSSTSTPKSTKKEETTPSGNDKTTKKSHVDVALVEKAVSALIKYHDKMAEGDGNNTDIGDNKGKKKEKIKPKTMSIFGTDQAIHVQFGLEIAPIMPSRKPIRIEIPHPIHGGVTADELDDNAMDTSFTNSSLEEPDVCLIVKDEAKPGIQEMISNFPKEMGFCKKVLTLTSLRKKHGTFKQRRDLLHKYDVFMADDRILPMLTKALGKEFLAAKKQPIPVKVTRASSLPFSILKALRSTFLIMGAGDCINVKAGSTALEKKKLVDNILSVSEGVPISVPRKWANIRSISIKTANSMSLPIYNKTPAELDEIGRLAGLDPVWKSRVVAKKDGPVKDDASAAKKELKRKTAANSPLVRALKKQKQEEQDNEKKKGSKKKDSKVTEVPKGDSKKKRKTRAEQEAPTTERASEVAVSTPSKRTRSGSKDEQAGKSKVTAKNDEVPVSTVKASAKKPKAETKNYIAAQKFAGSKKGYIFKKGSSGVGYYIDIKPVINKPALQALARTAKQPASRKGGKRQSGGSAKRRSRR